MWFNEVTQSCVEVRQNRKEFQIVCDELILISDELIYFTAYLFLLKPYLTNPLLYEQSSPNAGTLIAYKDSFKKNNCSPLKATAI